jgi:nitrate reductase gamma subunit
MKAFIAGGLFFLVLFYLIDESGASWLIDMDRYHVSTHGQLACQDCHSDILKKSLHPDSADINRTLPDFFHPEQCTSCHESVLESVKDDQHGGAKIASRKAFIFCIGCHDPHYQLSYSKTAAKFDPTQPKEKKCSICHRRQKELPKFSSQDEACLSCHRSMKPGDPKEAGTISDFCSHCHAKNTEKQPSKSLAVIDRSAYGRSAHAELPCLTCHRGAAEFRHANQKLGDCRQCHLPHDEKVAHDAHTRVSCGACHLKHVLPIKAASDDRIGYQVILYQDESGDIHSMISAKDDVFCRRCHFKGNSIGAAAMVLPAKSVICMPCHTATFSVGDTTTIIALIIFGLGILAVGSVWLTGSLVRGADHGVSGRFFRVFQSVRGLIFSRALLSIIQTLILDGLLQRRLFRISRSRWLNHALIFFPFLIRFSFGLVALLTSIWWPEWPGARIMVDKNHPLTAFVFDMSGVLFIFGVGSILVKKYVLGSMIRLEGLPGEDWLAYGLLGGIFIVGFILEGLRIAMTGAPEGSHYAFLGYTISRLFAGARLTGLYGPVWTVHAFFTGAFVAYLPFSRMFHMIMAPVVLAINAAKGSHK